MTDQLDEAQALEERERDAGIDRVVARLNGTGALYCASCGDEIDPARRAVMPSATRCTDCQDRRERWLRSARGR